MRGRTCPSLGGEVTVAVKQLLGGRAAGVDEVAPELLKDVRGLAATCPHLG